jgi:hypothetical protein
MSLEESRLRRKSAGRNDPCPCGSGKKYKKCHAAEDEAAVSEELAKQHAVAVAEAADAEAAAEHDPKRAAGGKAPGNDPKGPRGSSKGSGSTAGAVASRAASLPRRGAV